MDWTNFYKSENKKHIDIFIDIFEEHVKQTSLSLSVADTNTPTDPCMIKLPTDCVCKSVDGWI